MLTRRQTLRALGATAMAAPLLSACGDHRSGPMAEAGVRLVTADAAPSAGDAAAVPGVVDAMRAFTLDLWPELPSGGTNLALSPYSIAVALAMTANGAAGTTLAQMLDVLHIGSVARHNAGVAALTQQLDGLAGPVTMPDGKRQELALAAADQLFGDRAMTWEHRFLTVLAQEYGAGMRTVDFSRAPDTARRLVNRWTAEQTHDRIPEILPAGVVDSSTRLVLVNALYFKAPWQLPFEKGSTSRSPFHRSDGSSVTVEMMHADAEGPQRYLAGRHFEGARLPYAGGAVAMTVALPHPGHELEALSELLAGGVRAEGETRLTLTMPRWTFRTATNLAPVLTELGMADAFGPGADFSRMTARERVHLSFALHQAFVAVDEDGTEAAAATAVGVADSAVISSRVLVLDRPFVFVIHDIAHGTPLFVGRVADPS